MKLPQSVEEVAALLKGQNYISSTSTSTIVFLAIQMQRPILVEGPAGVGKTELAKSLAKGLGVELIHLQCYEGLDETKAIYEWEYAKQLLYTQLLKEKIHDLVRHEDNLSEAVKKVISVENAFFSEHFLLPRPLLKSITLGKPNVLLIDEVDKSDPEFEAYLLEVLSTYQITIPELGTLSAKVPPMVFLTSNAARDLSDALKRRCLHLFIDFPTSALESQIVRQKFPGLSERLIGRMVKAIGLIREMDLRKKPSIAETLDWAQALVSLQAQDLTPQDLTTTLGVIVKYQSDADQVQKKAALILEEAP
ncbi:MAG: ATPase [Candidatus Lambdaproteobacteria bacterium RIFOXYD1_FULL_56_27]|uniref:ATPase n=1 Tax=Candidatus Lambdaproteobacteria bacterium RIFOXYD2_FULL_56_26 TaxID=1817773 RepID=A0A1F6GTX6_9PROT|nr:MAG: ATPase [Candidatus Lambdaproteobacteria bacterium RIFOXYC1_FULL_56_13]OGH01534.1 MAG: ATPase [Candidatus Lambdaproteobacteria bacterium RIFOXYD2_FULL_56_26]OGH06755.1 MAG: ATPase [Candidatus Lambdaproteobacteria bacterium RIFOXYD1_FULL_56_27]